MSEVSLLFPATMINDFEPETARPLYLKPEHAKVDALASIAISLKRIADVLTGPCNEYGETMVEAISGSIKRGLRS